LAFQIRVEESNKCGWDWWPHTTWNSALLRWPHQLAAGGLYKFSNECSKHNNKFKFSFHFSHLP
jgi:hypothetical protein